MKINLSWLCGLCKRHSPSRHRIYLVCCKCGFRPKPDFLCRICSKNRIPVKVEKMRKAIGNRVFVSFADEVHEWPKGENK